MTSADAEAIGVDPAQLRKMAASGRLVRVMRGVYRVPQLPVTPLTKYAAAALWTGRRAAVSHESALTVHGLGDFDPTQVHLTAPPTYQPRGVRPPSYRIWHRPLPPADVTDVDSVQVVTVERALRDVIASGSAADPVHHAITQALQAGHLTEERAGALHAELDSRRSTPIRNSPHPKYQPLSLVDLGALLAVASDDRHRWRLVAELLEEFRQEPATSRAGLLKQEPAPTGSEHWDVFLAALAEYLSARDDRAAPLWAEARRLDVFWFPFNTPAARVDAFVHAPASFRRRGIYVAPQELNVA